MLQVLGDSEVIEIGCTETAVGREETCFPAAADERASVVDAESCVDWVLAEIAADNLTDTKVAVAAVKECPARKAQSLLAKRTAGRPSSCLDWGPKRTKSDLAWRTCWVEAGVVEVRL